jgi:hypothetical protein
MKLITKKQMFVVELYDPMRILRLSSFVLIIYMKCCCMLYCADHVKVLGSYSHTPPEYQRINSPYIVFGSHERAESNRTAWTGGRSGM